MTPGRLLLLGLFVAALGVLSACGSPSMDFVVNSPPVLRLTPPGPVSTTGATTEHGNVTVHGVRYDASTARMTANGRSAGVSDLKKGQIVSVVGTVHGDRVTGTASLVDCEASASGPVEVVDAAGGSLVVMGQTVVTAAWTEFDPRIDPDLLSGLSVGVRVQVYGWRNREGGIMATRVDLDGTSPDVQVLGAVYGLDRGNALFVIGDLDVYYGEAAHIDVAGGTPTDGMAVVARGVLADGTLIAREIRSVPVERLYLYGEEP